MRTEESGLARQHFEEVRVFARRAIDLGDVRLDDERPVTGVVVDQDSRPVTGATVVVDADYDHPATTDVSGRFAVRDAAIDATWFLVFEEPGHAPAVFGLGALEAGQRQRTIDLAATEGGSIAGRVEHVPEAMAGQVWVVAFNDYLDVLTDFVERFETEHCPMSPISDADMLRHLIEARGITQAKLSADVDMPMSTISEVIHGKKKLTRRQVGILAEHFGVPPSVFLD